jgi:hypothetical protein
MATTCDVVDAKGGTPGLAVITCGLRTVDGG